MDVTGWGAAAAMATECLSLLRQPGVWRTGSYREGLLPMRWKLISESTERTFVVVLDHGDEVMHALHHFLREHHVTAARVSAIGAFRKAELAFFDPVQKVYVPIFCGQQVEALSCLGDVTVEAGHPKLHLHAVVGRRDGTALGGHLVSAEVYPTFEVMIVESPAYLQRVFDPAVGLSLIQLPAE